MKDLYGRHGSFLTIWRAPEEKGQYVAGADPATGQSHSASCCYVMNTENGEVVACLHGWWPENVFTDKLHDLMQQYNEAFLAVESSGGYGQAILFRLLDMWGYPNLYFQRRFLGRIESQRETPRPGFSIDRATRPKVLADLYDDLREGNIAIYDVEFFREAATFQYDARGIARGMPGRSDDRVIAMALTAQMRREMPYVKLEEKEGPLTMDEWHLRRQRAQARRKQRLQQLAGDDDRMEDIFTHMRDPERELLDELEVERGQHAFEY